MLPKKLLLSLALLSLVLGSTGPGFAASPDTATPVAPAPAVAPAAKPSKYADAVAKLAAAPAPAPGGVLMIGSSIFRKWTTAAQDLAPLPVTNRAFGGSRTADQLQFFDQLVPSSQAALVVWYCGSNDVNSKKKPPEVLQNTQDWIAKTRAALPNVRIVLLSVIRAPQKHEDGYLPQVDDINKRLSALAADAPDLTYVDVNPSLETEAGEPVAACYVADKLHMSPEGYQRIRSVLLPVLKAQWKAPAKAAAAP
jgi:lysophospholipase L1-like esterase